MHPRRINIWRKPQSFGVPLGQPMRACLLCIDAATQSGLALYVCGKLHHYTELKAHDGAARRRALRDACTVAEVRGLPLGCVIEVPFGGRAQAALSLTAICALWRDSWAQLGQRSERWFEYTANEWRRQLFGVAGMPRAEVRKLEQALAASTAQRDMPQRAHYTLGGDESAAICIGQVAIRSGAIAAALGLPINTDRRHTV